MTAFTKETENYIEHEVQLRIHSSYFAGLEKSINRLDASIEHLDNKLERYSDKLDSKIKHLDDKLEKSIDHLDNKFMLMFSIVLGSIWLPAILHYLHIT